MALRVLVQLSLNFHHSAVESQGQRSCWKRQIAEGGALGPTLKKCNFTMYNKIVFMCMAYFKKMKT